MHPRYGIYLCTSVTSDIVLSVRLLMTACSETVNLNRVERINLYEFASGDDKMVNENTATELQFMCFQHVAVESNCIQ
jgi:hypothetical protein